MTFSKGICLISILALCFTSCEYEPEGVNFKEVDPTGIQTIEIALDQIKDTLIVGTWTQVGFDIEFPKTVNFTMKVRLGTTTIYSAASESGAFVISPFEFSNGFYPLIFEVVSSTGTLSLADRLEVEKVLFEYQGKVVQIETSPAQKTNIISIVPEADGLHITWPRYPKANFVQYVLHKAVSPTERGYPEFDQFIFTDIRQTSFVDPDFLGGSAEYKLQVFTMTDLAFGDPKTLRIDPPAINRLKATDINTLEVGWPKSAFSTAFGSYHLLEDYTFGVHDYFTTTSINDTVTIINDFPFGASVRAELRTQPKTFEEDYAHSGTYSTFADLYLGDKIPDNMVVLEVKDANRLYYYRQGYLYAMRNNEKKPYDSLEITLNISDHSHNSPCAQSPDGQYFYVSSGSKLIRINTETLDEISSISLPDVVGQSNVFPFSIAVNNNNRLVVDVRQQPSSGGMPLPVFISSNVAIIDGDSETVTDILLNTSDVISIETSASQGYVLINTADDTKAFEISPAGSEVRQATITATSIKNALFTASQVHIFDNNSTNTFSLSDFTLVSSMSHTEFLYASTIDPLTGHLGVTTSEDEFSIYDPVSMTLLNKIKIGRDANSPDDFIQLMNNHLISKAGFRMALP